MCWGLYIGPHPYQVDITVVNMLVDAALRLRLELISRLGELEQNLALLGVTHHALHPDYSHQTFSAGYRVNGVAAG